MFRWTPYVFIRFTLFLIAGILLYGWQPNLAPLWITLVFIVGLMAYVSLWFTNHYRTKKLRLQVWFGALAAVILASFGWLMTHHATETNEAYHLLHQPEIEYYTGTVISEVQTRAKNYRATLRVDKIVSAGKAKPASGKVLIYTAKDTPKPQYGDQLLIYGKPQPLNPPANPGEFDYRQYLSLQQIHFQQFVKKDKLLIYGRDAGNPIVAASLQVRAWADSVFRQHIRRPQEYAIVSGLVLGIRDGLDNELKNAYASAGAMHVLAVSGAHVIIVFQLIVLFLGRFKRIRYGNYLFAFTALLILWFYAFVTGLSASVLRAVIMFSFVVIGEAARKEGNLFNTLGISAFGLLCYDPYLLQDVGFQLSYLAVAGIVYLYPKIYRWFDLQNWLLDKVWEMTCVSLAAQLAVFPLTLFYFHQFPTYFLIANVLVIPISTGVLYGGLALLTFAWIPYLSDLLTFVLQGITWLLNQTAFLTEKTPGALVQGIYLNVWELLLLYLLLAILLLFFYRPQLRWWGMAVVLLTGLSISQAYAKTRFRDQRLLAVYAIPGHATLDVIDGNRHIFLADSALLHNENRILFHLRNHWGTRQVLTPQKILFSKANSSALAVRQMQSFSVFTWHGKRFCILHQPTSLSVFANQKFDYLIVQNSSLKNLKTLPLQSFGQVVLDASNRFYLSKRLKKSFTEQGVACHNVQEDGAFLLEL